MENIKHIAILGGGPSGLFMYKRFVDSGLTDLTIDIFEKKQQLGAGMPYSDEGANEEHITNVSGNEIPEIVTPISEWLATLPKRILNNYNIEPKNYNDYKVLPRLLFGKYLTHQFNLLLAMGKAQGIRTNIHYNSIISDIIDFPEKEIVKVEVNNKELYEFDTVIICTGHNWPEKHEGKVPGYYDSPYPPQKISFKVDHAVAIKGSSLTAIDAIRTLSRTHGSFTKQENGKLEYQLLQDCENFKIVMHSRNGLLPAIRFHLENSHLHHQSILSKEEIVIVKAKNDGFLPLDLVFEKNFKDIFKEKDREFYDKIKDMEMETFVKTMMDLRERLDPFLLLKAEFIEAEKSIKRKESIFWKEMLAVLSFAMNYPAKYFSAEDMQRLQKVLMPLISIVIAFVPQNSVKEVLALYDAGVLNLISVGDNSEVKITENDKIVYKYLDDDKEIQSIHFETFIDCVGQPHLSFGEFPYPSLLIKKTLSPANVKFRDSEAGKEALSKNEKGVNLDNDGNYYLKVPGIKINDNFQVVNEFNAFNDRIYMMAVPYMGGLNPDYSGLDFCEAASKAIIEGIFGIKEKVMTIPISKKAS